MNNVIDIYHINGREYKAQHAIKECIKAPEGYQWVVCWDGKPKQYMLKNEE